ncbi:hypothetical protein TNCV_2520121 [Trichonephila clavipes]|uniref:Uncharacterized protein n=1 Tax=Trichonephila clavipes TaxID=2585209 RepID=A0A8X6V2U2_TRICX|nr:hypothetical protein TNCV_2520121 [Trichonephila clavipes]
MGGTAMSAAAGHHSSYAKQLFLGQVTMTKHKLVSQSRKFLTIPFDVHLPIYAMVFNGTRTRQKQRKSQVRDHNHRLNTTFLPGHYVTTHKSHSPPTREATSSHYPHFPASNRKTIHRTPSSKKIFQKPFHTLQPRRRRSSNSHEEQL